jgi:putative ABC transport system substrate-binding protein
MKRPAVAYLVLTLLAAPLAAEAQRAGNVPRVGLLCVRPCKLESTTREGRALEQALRELGYVEGRNIAFDYGGHWLPYERLADAAVALAGRKVDVILVDGSAAARAAKAATTTIPIVLVGVADVVEQGLVQGLAHPGGNVTGLTLPFADLVRKQLELLKEVVPWVSRVGVLWNPANPEHELPVKAVEAVAHGMGLQLQRVPVRSHDEYGVAFSSMSRGAVGALLVVADPQLFGAELTLFAAQRGMPTISLRREFVESGGLLAYGVSGPAMSRRAATYLDKILKGVRPADLPVEEPTKFELVVNLKTAKALGLTIPQSVLLRADEVVQ